MVTGFDLGFAVYPGLHASSGALGDGDAGWLPPGKGDLCFCEADLDLALTNDLLMVGGKGEKEFLVFLQPAVERLAGAERQTEGEPQKQADPQQRGAVQPKAEEQLVQIL